MISAFTLVRAVPHRNVEVLERIKNLSLIKEASLVYGEYDLIVETSTKTIEELNKFIYNVLRKIPHITMTTTMIVAEFPVHKHKP